MRGWADAQAQAPEIRRAEFGLNVFQAVVTTIAAALLEADAAGWQVEFVVDDENFLRRNFVEIGQCGNRLAGTVHEGHRLQ